MSEDTEDAAAALVLAVELEGLEQPLELVLQPITVLHLVGLLQLASRHPNIGPESAHARLVGNFLTAARSYFADCPFTLAVIERGDDPAEDVPGT